MRRILIEQARRKKTLRQGGEYVRIALDAAEVTASAPASQDYLALDEALTKLADVDTEAATLVKLRFFAGLTVDEAAEALGISSRTAKRNWAFARAWLQRKIDEQ